MRTLLSDQCFCICLTALQRFINLYYYYYNYNVCYIVCRLLRYLAFVRNFLRANLGVSIDNRVAFFSFSDTEFCRCVCLRVLSTLCWFFSLCHSAKHLVNVPMTFIDSIIHSLRTYRLWSRLQFNSMIVCIHLLIYCITERLGFLGLLHKCNFFLLHYWSYLWQHQFQFSVWSVFVGCTSAVKQFCETLARIRS